MTSDHPPIACSLSADARKDRGEAWRAVATSGLRSRSAVPAGVRLEFEPGREIARALLDLVAAERDCCAWASWTMTSTAEATVVEAAADESGAPVLQAMFDVRP